MTVPLPESYSFGKVVGRVIHAIADTAADPDALPEAKGAAGSIIFTPVETMRAVTGGGIVLHEPTTVTLDAAGYVVDAEGNPGVWLVAGTYSVQFRLTSGTVAKQTIAVTESHTDAAPFDLVDSIGYVSPSGTTVQTLLVPAGGTTGQVLGFGGAGELVWTDPAAAGVTGDGITTIRALTQAEYDAIVTPDPATLYVITG